MGIVLLSTPSIAATGGALLAGSLSINDVSLTEGDEGSRTLTFTVTHTGLSDPFYVDAFTADGTATVADNDYSPEGGQAGFNGTDGETLTFSVEVTGDVKDESPHEVFYVDLSNVLPFGAPGPLGLPTIADARGEGKIIDNDGGAGGGTPTVSINDVTKQEGNSGRTNFDFTVTLSADSDPFSIQVATSTANGMAVDGTQGGGNPEQDFIPKQDTLNFAGTAGETETFRVQVLGDKTAESNETFFANLGSFGGSGSKPEIADGQGRGTITDDDAQGLAISPPARGYRWNPSGQFKIEVVGSGTWNAKTDVGWIEIVSAQSKDAGTLLYSVAENRGTEIRSGTISIGNNTHVVRQASFGPVGPTGESWTDPDSFTFYGRYAAGSPQQQLSNACASSLRGVDPVASLGSGPSELCTIDAVPAASLLIPFVLTDTNGDGKEETAVKGIEPRTRSRGGRGAWLQFYNDKGKRLLNVFPGANFTGLQLLALDLDGNGKAAPVVLGTQDSGASELQVLNAKGGRVQSRQTVSPAGADVARVMAFELDGRPGTELGVAYKARNGTGHFAVWGLPRGSKKLQRLAPARSVISNKSRFQEWLPTDVDGDGRSEIVAAYAATNERGATLRVLDPVSGKVLTSKKVLNPTLDQAVWRVADFDQDAPGTELLVGYRRKSNGGVGFKVVNGGGKTLSSGSVSGKATAHTWEAIRSKPGPRGGVSNLVFVGLTRANGDRDFEVWDPSRKRAKRIGSGTVATDDAEVIAWLVQDFDGDSDNGPEVVAVTRRVGDGSVGFQVFGTDGKPRGNRVEAFDGNYIDVSAAPTVFARKTRVDLKLTARMVGGQPEIHIWNVADVVLLKTYDVLSSDVQ